MKLNYKTLGQGPALVILHGLFGSLDNWMTLAREFSAHFSVFVVDQRNHGRSPHADAWNYEEMAEDLHEFLLDQGLHQASLLGHSMGGKTVMQFADMYPSMVEKLVVADMAPRAYPPHHGSVLSAMNAVPLADIDTRQQADSIMSQYLPDAETRQLLLKALTREEDKYRWRFNLELLTEKYDEVIAPVIFQAPLEMPALFIYGGKSDYVTEADRKFIEIWFHQASFAEISDAGHWLHAERPEIFFNEVNSFLRENN